ISTAAWSLRFGVSLVFGVWNFVPRPVFGVWCFGPRGSWPTAIKSKTNGSVLVALLWCLALLSVVVIGILHTATLDLRIVKNQGDVLQAHYLAMAGIEKAKALLYQDAIVRKRSAKNHTGELYDSPQQ